MDGTTSWWAHRLIIAAAVLHSLMILEDVPPDYNLEQVIMLEPDDQLYQPAPDQRRQQVSLSSYIKINFLNLNFSWC